MNAFGVSEVTLEGTQSMSTPTPTLSALLRAMTRTLADAHEHCGIIGQTWRAPQSLVVSARRGMALNAAEQRYNTMHRSLRWLIAN